MDKIKEIELLESNELINLSENEVKHLDDIAIETYYLLKRRLETLKKDTE